MTLEIIAEEVMADLRSAGWLEQELHPELDRHRRHQMADICESGNVERVWRVLGLGIAEIRFALLKILVTDGRLLAVNELERPERWEFSFSVELAAETMSFLKEKIHEYLVAAVMADRVAVIIPGAAAVWQQRASETLASLRDAAVSAACRQRPARRPLWPFI